MNVHFNPAMRALGYVSGIINIGSLASGVYQGLAEARDVAIHPDTLSVIKWGPIIVSGILGIPMSRVIWSHENLEEMGRSLPSGMDESNAASCTRGCSSILTPVLGMTFTYGFQYLGYIIGKAIYHA